MNSSTPKEEQILRDAKTLLDTVGVSRVVIVDDEYAASVEDFLGVCSDLPAAERAKLPHLDHIEADMPYDLWTDATRDVWKDLKQSESRSLLREARTLHAASTEASSESQPEEQQLADDYMAASSLDRVLGDLTDLEFVPLSLGEWKEQGDKLLQDVKAAETVVLFDRDFSREEAGAENEGLALIREVQSADVGYCGLISHTVSVGGEHAAWNSLSEEHGINRDKFLVISKERLRGEPPDYYGFLGLLRLTALSGLYASVKRKAWSIFENSLSEAKRAMEGLSVLDFDRVVFASSRSEGVWEPDTLFRVFGILMRRQAQLQMRQNDDISDAVMSARQVSAAPEEVADALTDANSSNEALQMQRFEIYDQGDELNCFHAPIDLGDIFRCEADGKRYILLAQPCDLMVRKNGMRSYEKPRHGRLAAVVELMIGANQKQGNWGTLPFYDEDAGKPAFANFARVHHVPLVVLDLCAMRRDGAAMIDPKEDCPTALIEPWQERHGKLCKYFGKALGRYEQLTAKKHDDDVTLIALPGSSNTLRLEPAVNDGKLQYGVKRVLRLRQPWSGALLTEFTQYQARAAFEHFFGPCVEPSNGADGSGEQE